MAPPFNQGRGMRGRGRGRGRGSVRHGGAPGGRHKSSTTNLPAALSAEMENSSSKFFVDGDDRDFSQRFKNRAAGRKAQRKRERAQKKKHRTPTLSKIELLARQQHISSTPSMSSNKIDDKKGNKKQKLDPERLEVNMDEHEGETLVTDIASPEKKPRKLKEAKQSPSSKDSSELDAKRLEKLSKSNPAFYAMLQEDGVVAGGGSSFESGFDEDEQYIRHYEKKLGLKRKDVEKLASKKSFMDDGLGDILQGIELGSKGFRPKSTTARKESARNPDDSFSKSGSLSSAGKKRSALEAESEDDDSELNDSEEGDDMDSFDEELEGIDPEDMADSDMEDDMEDDMEGDMEDDMEDDMEGFDGESDDGDSGPESEDDESDDPEGLKDLEDDDLSEDDSSGEEDTQLDKAIERTRDAVTKPATTAQTGKYLPPHLRAAAEAAATAEGGASALAKAIPRKNTEELLRLRRQLQGLLNKLSESNIESILMEIEGVYRQYPRADVTETITDMILASISSKANLLDSFVILYATVVASLYRLVGIEFAAHFIQTLVEQFDVHHAFASSTKSTEMTEETLSAVKQCTNLIVLVSELYNMQVIACVLVYELIRWFMTELSELNVELVVKIVKTSGYQLRQDDPTTLKTIIQDFTVLANQASTKGGSSTPISSRTRFLLETLTALKANRMKGPSTNSTTSGTITESTTRMKKFLSGLSKKRTTFASEPMRVGLTDIRQVKTKGKWWLVGSSWKNNMVGEETHKSFSTSTADDVLKAEDELLALARKNKMNTDVRRSVFVVLMSSEDYMDAFERLLRLNLKEVQQREIVRVLLHCAGNEMVYNPYYTLVGQRLSQHDHSFKITFQYALWDFLREMGATDVGGMEKVRDGQVVGLEDGVDASGKKVPLRRIVNLSKMYGFLITSQDLSLVMLKTVTFTSLQEQPTTFFQLLLTNIILSSQPQLQLQEGTSKEKPKYNAQALADIFIRAAVNPTLAQGIIFFLQAFVKKGQVCSTDRDKETVKWGCTTAKEVLRGAINTGGRF
ncbi:MAG: hypothetical protein J3Q66DRAFT_297038 [Benniella sp.]|nr:MAG: hypothetical protein J3Q66DRAFT_297038 [Benniella sp.]